MMPDGLPGYRSIGKTPPHLATNHSAGRMLTLTPRRIKSGHVDRVESFTGFMHSAVTGVFQWISGKHRERYAGEAGLRWNRNIDTCLDRMLRVVRNGADRLPSYTFLVAQAVDCYLAEAIFCSFFGDTADLIRDERS